MFTSITLSLDNVDHLSKIWITTFWPMAKDVKKTPLWVLKDGLATELLRQTCKGGLTFLCIAACVSSNLKQPRILRDLYIRAFIFLKKSLKLPSMVIINLAPIGSNEAVGATHYWQLFQFKHLVNELVFVRPICLMQALFISQLYFS